MEFAAAAAVYAKTGETSAILTRDDYTMSERFDMLPRVLPFVILLTGVMIALYGGFATPSETAGLGALLAMILIAGIYSVWTDRKSTRLNSSHQIISYAVFCLKKKKWTALVAI